MTDLHIDLSRVVASPHAIRSASFSSARHGLDEREVRAYLERLASEVEAADAERTSLRTEAAELRQEVERLRTARPDEDQIRTEISVRAVELLSRAQQAADDAVAEAEQYARDLVMTAREQYRDVLHRAQDAASSAADAVPGSSGGAGTAPAYSHPVPEIEYVRTFARVAQAQLKSVLDVLADEVDKLGHLPRMPEGSTPPPARPQPEAPAQPEAQEHPEPQEQPARPARPEQPQRRARWLSEGLPPQPVEEHSVS